MCFFNKQHFSGPIKSEWKVRLNGKLKPNHMGRHDVILRSIKLTFCEVFIRYSSGRIHESKTVIVSSIMTFLLMRIETHRLQTIRVSLR